MALGDCDSLALPLGAGNGRQDTEQLPATPPPRQKGKQARKRKDHSEMDASKHSSVCLHTWLKGVHSLDGRKSPHLGTSSWPKHKFQSSAFNNKEAELCFGLKSPMRKASCRTLHPCGSYLQGYRILCVRDEAFTSNSLEIYTTPTPGSSGWRDVVGCRRRGK